MQALILILWSIQVISDGTSYDNNKYILKYKKRKKKTKFK